MSLSKQFYCIYTYTYLQLHIRLFNICLNYLNHQNNTLLLSELKSKNVECIENFIFLSQKLGDFFFFENIVQVLLYVLSHSNISYILYIRVTMFAKSVGMFGAGTFFLILIKKNK